MISGLGDSCLDFVTSESNERFIHELSNDFFEELGAMEDFPDLSETELRELEELEKKTVPLATESQTKRYVDMFRNFLSEKQLCTQFEKVPDRFLCNYLRFFYSQLRMKNGDFYSPSTLICVRSAIHRHLTSVSVDRNVDILHGVEFKRANSVLKSMVGRYLSSGQVKRKQYEAITSDDMRKVNDYFDRSTNRKMQEEVLFNIIYHFGLRGRENLRELKRDTFTVLKDGQNKEFLSITKELAFKNVKASLNRKHFEDIKRSRMYAIDDKSKCPVECFKRYMDLLPDSTLGNTLFPKCIKDGFSSCAVLGKDSLGNFMKELSKKANLNNVYTNHCIRVTVVSVLQERGVSNEHISMVTGHKNASSLQHYTRLRTEKTLQEIGDHLNDGKRASENSKHELKKESVFQSNEIIVKRTSETCATTATCGGETNAEDPCPTKIVKIVGPFNQCTFNF
jgi:site-specific recombinase XerD